MPNVHVSKNPNGGWDVKLEGTEEPMACEATQEAAIAFAKDITQGHGEIKVHKEDGTFSTESQ